MGTIQGTAYKYSRDLTQAKTDSGTIMFIWNKVNINQDIIIEFANDILKNGFPISQLEIDDKWVTEHGDLTPDPEKFPNMADMTKQLHDMGIKVTIWTHPFFNIESDSLQETLPSKTFTDYDDEDKRDFYVKAGQERY